MQLPLEIGVRLMVRLHRKIHRFLALEPPVRRCLVISMVSEPVARLLLKTTGYSRTMRVMNFCSGITSKAVAEFSIEDIEEGFNLAMRQLPSRDGCLSRAIVLYGLLRATRHLVKLRLGVQTDQNALAAHAWVEVNGIAVAPDGKLSRQFAPLGVIAR